MTDRIGRAIAREVIVCPKCETEQDAVAMWWIGDPFPSYVHACVGCGYMITESEWQPANPKKET